MADNILKECLGKPQELSSLVSYANDSVVSKTVINKDVGTVTLFAFDKGQSLSEHTSPYDAIVEVIDGKATLTIDGNDVEVGAGQLIIMPGNVPHSVNANEKFKMVLVMIRA